MLKPAFSTLACHTWTLEQVAAAAGRWGFLGVELRTFDDGSAAMACDPACTAPRKTLEVLARGGVEIAGVATSTRFDQAVTPPVIGRIFGDYERPVREAKRATALAKELGAPFVRVFAFEGREGESKASVMRRIVDRLHLAADDARHSGVRLALENGGGFPRAADVAEIVQRVGSPLLGVCYSVAVGTEAGEPVRSALDALGDDLFTVRVGDLGPDGPVPLGAGTVPCEQLVRELARRGYDGWVVVEWDRMWLPELAEAESALPGAARKIMEWSEKGAVGRGSLVGV